MIGVSDHGGWAVLVTAASDAILLDRRRVELVGEGFPKLPHHTEGQRFPLDEAVELVERVPSVGGKVRGPRGRCHDSGAAYPRCRPSQVPAVSTYACRANHGLPCSEQCRLGDVPQGPGLRGRGTGLACPLVRREERVGRGASGRCVWRTSTLTSARYAKTSGRPGTRITNSQWRRLRHGDRGCGISRGALRSIVVWILDFELSVLKCKRSYDKQNPFKKTNGRIDQSIESPL